MMRETDGARYVRGAQCLQCFESGSTTAGTGGLYQSARLAVDNDRRQRRWTCCRSYCAAIGLGQRRGEQQARTSVWGRCGRAEGMAQRGTRGEGVNAGLASTRARLAAGDKERTVNAEALLGIGDWGSVVVAAAPGLCVRRLAHLRASAFESGPAQPMGSLARPSCLTLVSTTPKAAAPPPVR